MGPEEFGLVGMFSVFIVIGTVIVDSGLYASLIRTINADEDDFSTVFYLNVGFSFLVYIVFFLAAPSIATFFNQAVLVDMMRLYCIGFIFSAMSMVQLARLHSVMNFKKTSLLAVPGTVLGIVAGVLLGLWEFGAWAIVWMNLIPQFVFGILLWVTSSWRPKLLFSISKAKSHFRFGYKLLLSGLLNTSFDYIYNILIGKFYKPQVLGFFERARSLNEYPSTILTGIISKVTYPMLSGIQNDKVKISTVYRRLFAIVFFLVSPVLILAAALAKPIFLLILGKEWMEAVPFFQILSLAFIFYPINAFNLNVFKVYGRSDLFLNLEIVKKVMIVICIAVSFQFGVLGMVWSIVVSSALSLFINAYFSSKIIDFPIKQQLADLLPIAIFSSAMFVVVFFVIPQLENLYLILQLTIGISIGLIVYLSLNFLFKSPALFYSVYIIKKLFKYDTDNKTFPSSH